MAAADSAFVIDASATLALCFEDETSPLTETILGRLADNEAFAPAIWPLEVANGIRSAERRGRITEAELPGLGQLLLGLPIRVEDVRLEVALRDVLQLARSLGLSAYDAAYVALALSRRLPLATVDDQMARGALASGAMLLEPEA